MVAIILALASAISYGGSDFAAGLASRSADVIRVILIASLAGLAVILVAFPLAASHPPGAAALIWGVVVGLSGTVGALALYLGFRHAAFSVAGPLSAVGAAGFSVLAGLLLGEHPTALALTGIVLALPAIVGVSASAASGSREPTAASDGTGQSSTIPRRRPRRSRQSPGQPRRSRLTVGQRRQVGRPRGWPRAWSPGLASRSCSSGSTRPAPAAACGRSPSPRSPRSW